MEEILNKCLVKAIEIATIAHKNQKDKGGKPYILHPLRVSNACKQIDEKIVAILHDTIEDTNITADILKNYDFPIYIINAILSITRRESESYDDFIKRVAQDEIGRIVKIHDLEDNMNITRLNELTEKDFKRLQKYFKSYKYLINYER